MADWYDYDSENEWDNVDTPDDDPGPEPVMTYMDAQYCLDNGAYDERGGQVLCEHCMGEMMWNPVMAVWYCTECEDEMEREDYFAYIGAVPPGRKCISQCEENYPYCKRWCPHYEIDPDDPMMS